MPRRKLNQCCPEEPASRLNQTRNAKEELASLAKALAHPVRLQILEILKSKKSCVCGEIVDELPLAQATVSQHLKVLKNAGFIRGAISGPATCYCIASEKLARFKSLASKL